MAIPDTISAAVADKPEVLKWMKDTDAKADKLTPEVEAAIPKLGELAKLPDLTAKSEALAKLLEETKAKDPAALLKEITTVKAANADMIRRLEKVKEGGGAGAEGSPEYKALEEKFNASTAANDERIKVLEAENKTNKDTAAAATLKARDTDLKNAVIAAAAKHKIKNPDDEFLLLKAKGLIGHKEDGTAFFHKLNEKGEKVDAGSAEALIKHLAETDKTKVDASGKGGAGQDHKGGAGGEGETPKTVQEARRAFRGV